MLKTLSSLSQMSQVMVLTLLALSSQIYAITPQQLCDEYEANLIKRVVDCEEEASAGLPCLMLDIQQRISNKAKEAAIEETDNFSPLIERLIRQEIDDLINRWVIHHSPPPASADEEDAEIAAPPPLQSFPADISPAAFASPVAAPRPCLNYKQHFWLGYIHHLTLQGFLSPLQQAHFSRIVPTLNDFLLDLLIKEIYAALTRNLHAIADGINTVGERGCGPYKEIENFLNFYANEKIITSECAIELINFSKTVTPPDLVLLEDFFYNLLSQQRCPSAEFFSYELLQASKSHLYTGDAALTRAALINEEKVFLSEPIPFDEAYFSSAPLSQHMMTLDMLVNMHLLLWPVAYRQKALLSRSSPELIPLIMREAFSLAGVHCSYVSKALPDPAFLSNILRHVITLHFNTGRLAEDFYMSLLTQLAALAHPASLFEIQEKLYTELSKPSFAQLP